MKTLVMLDEQGGKPLHSSLNINNIDSTKNREKKKKRKQNRKEIDDKKNKKTEKETKGKVEAPL